jgi:hypothetical protein
MNRIALCRMGIIAIIMGCGGSMSSHALAEDEDAAKEDTANDGQDVTRPVKRIDLRLNYTKPGASGGAAGELDSWSFIARHDRPINLGDGWQVGLRLDLPFLYNNLPTQADPAGTYRVGYGDTLGQALLIKAIDKRQAIGVGTQLIAPTGGGDQFGSGRWRLVPTAGYRYALSEISPGSFFVAAVRYDVDVGGQDRQGHVRNFQFSPTLNIGLPDAMFFTFFPSTDIRYDFIKQKWFVPFNAQIGKVWDKKIVTSLEIGVPIYTGGDALYKFKLEGRVGLFF